MTTETLPNAGQLEAPRLADNDHTPAGGTCCALRDEANHFLSCANEHVRKNPLPVVAGALVVGIGLGYLLTSGRSIPEPKASTFHDLTDHAGDFLSNSLASLRGNLKFW